MRDLVYHVVPSVAQQWYELGLQLLDPKYENELDTIEEDIGNDNKIHCRKMFSKWLKTEPLANWNKLIEALARTGLNSVASNITQLLQPGKWVATINNTEKCELLTMLLIYYFK